MADRKISDLTALTAPAAGDYLPIVDISEASAANKNKRITIEELLRGAPDGTAAAPSIGFESDPNTGIYSPGADQLAISTGGTERARIDSSGRLLVGISSARDAFFSSGTSARLQIEGSGADSFASLTRNNNDAGAPILFLAKSRGTGNTTVQNGDEIGRISFQGNDGSGFEEAALISVYVDGEPNTSGDTTDMPGRLVFSTTADGASSPTEWMRISQNGIVTIGQTSASLTTGGAYFAGPGNSFEAGLSNTRTDGIGALLYINRQGSDGNLVEFYQALELEGAISVSGTTVTYGGGHLARWSQLPNDEDPSSILKGTVMSNLDEMCEWGEEANEQLNKTKVSDVEGDPNVAGVFVSTSFSDDGPLDYFVAMTGDMIIRIAEGVTVQRGDLLMSAGDGTAKPQDDDIIRSKTIAKVTSTHVTCTYDDGSYCIP
jgi:hypothetical protein